MNTYEKESAQDFRERMTERKKIDLILCFIDKMYKLKMFNDYFPKGILEDESGIEVYEELADSESKVIEVENELLEIGYKVDRNFIFNRKKKQFEINLNSIPHILGNDENEDPKIWKTNEAR